MRDLDSLFFQLRPMSFNKDNLHLMSKPKFCRCMRGYSTQNTHFPSWILWSCVMLHHLLLSSKPDIIFRRLMTLMLVRRTIVGSYNKISISLVLGAMENWVCRFEPIFVYAPSLYYLQGLITGRTSGFLLDPKQVDMQGSYNALMRPSTDSYLRFD